MRTTFILTKLYLYASFKYNIQSTHTHNTDVVPARAFILIKSCVNAQYSRNVPIQSRHSLL